MEGIVHDFRSFGKNVNANAFEVHIVKLHVDEQLLVGEGSRPHIDPVRWRPLIMSFCQFFGLGGELHPSRLAESDFMKLVTQAATTQPAGLSRALGEECMCGRSERVAQGFRHRVGMEIAWGARGASEAVSKANGCF